MKNLRRKRFRLLSWFSRKSLSEIIVYSLVALIFLAFAFSYVYILFFVAVNGLKSHNEAVMHPWGLPQEYHFSNYTSLFTQLVVYEGTSYEANFLKMLFNSLYFSIIGSLLNMMFTAMAAYVTCKYKFKGSGIFYPLALLIMTIPIYGSGGALYKLYFRLGMINSYGQIFLSWGGFNLQYLYFYAAFSNLSTAYAEAASIDGAGDYTIYFRIMFPQVFNVFGALFILAWVADWNNYSSVLVYLPKIPTLAGGIYLFQAETQATVRQHILYAAYFLVSVPPLLLFAFFNKTFTTNISLGGVKE